ncbi:TonB-dependent receptor [Parashewanella curva]|uniref:TonB-dependent receptor n=1 Tax=Parashewanella curva TaxID=2338552 RepID=A0A3L8PXQ1_9GAMM|nr:TonB-dependent receptor [Parashewanella curva]RLV59228.1 TonB-dependent receptor [Parashewanella curva]
MRKQNQTFNLSSLGIAIGFALSGLTYTNVALADETETADAESIEKIAVVGTRSAPRSVGDSPVPVDIIGGDELEKAGNTDMLEILKGTVPSLNVHTNPISDAATLVRPMNLRGLSADSTLILLNGKRRHRSSVITLLGGGINDGAQGPDISVIPSIALKQVEVLRDGAAAQYGSDAIAGVVNFQLKDSNDGGSLEVKHGEYYEGDGTSTQISGNIGMPLSENGFANVSFQYKNADATSRSVQRPDAAGFASKGIKVDNPAQVWGSPKIKDDLTVFANLGLELDEHSSAYLFGNYSTREAKGGFYYRNPNNRPGVYGGIVREVNGQKMYRPGDDQKALQELWDKAPATVLVGSLDGKSKQLDCPLVPIVNGIPDQAALGSLKAANCFAFNMILPGGFTPNFGGEIIDTSITAGTKGEFQIDWLKGITYDFSGSYGRNDSKYFLYNTVNASLGPDTPRDFNPGQAINSELTFNADFVKFLDWGLTDEVALAFGAEWHKENYQVIAGDEASFKVGPLFDQGFSIGSNGFPGYKPSAAGDYSSNNKAVYVQTSLPMSENLLVDAALRYEDFDSFGSTLNYKVAGSYHLTDEFAVRGSVNTGFRAPTVGQQNFTNVQTELSGGVLVDSALLPPTNPISQELGGKALSPEESFSYTFGGVFTYGDLFVTVDYYNIKVEDRIGQSNKIELKPEQKAKLKAAGVPNVDGLTKVSFFTNDFDTTTQGIDLVANYSAQLFNGDSTFAFAYNWNETKVDKYSEITGEFKVARLEKDLPNHRATFTWSQSWEDVSMFTRANYFGEYQGVHVDFDKTVKTGSAAVTIDVEVNYNFNESFALAVGAQNLLDQDAERLDFQGKTGIPNNNWGGKFYETSPFGFNGGYWYVKGTYKF